MGIGVAHTVGLKTGINYPFTRNTQCVFKYLYYFLSTDDCGASHELHLYILRMEAKNEYIPIPTEISTRDTTLHCSTARRPHLNLSMKGLPLR